KPRFGVSVDTTKPGNVAKQVFTNSVAEKAGVRAGDEIVSLDGKETKTYDALLEAIRGAKGKVSLVVERDGERITLEAVFDDKKDEKKDEKKPPEPDKRWF
ncbi:PDZ domain-containing protein, partial [bacterium]|nr:PDZ domain-containing protein [bacterium]